MTTDPTSQTPEETAFWAKAEADHEKEIAECREKLRLLIMGFSDLSNRLTAMLEVAQRHIQSMEKLHKL